MEKRTHASLSLSLSPPPSPARPSVSSLLLAFPSSSRPRRGRKVPFLFRLWNDFLSRRFNSAPRGFIIYAMGYANYDKVQIFHMTCTCVTPLSTRDRLTRHVNRDARDVVCVYIYVQRSKFRRVSWDLEVIPPKCTQYSANYIPYARRPRETFSGNWITSREIMSASI